MVFQYAAWQRRLNTARALTTNASALSAATNGGGGLTSTVTKAVLSSAGAGAAAGREEATKGRGAGHVLRDVLVPSTASVSGGGGWMGAPYTNGEAGAVRRRVKTGMRQKGIGLLHVTADLFLFFCVRM